MSNKWVICFFWLAMLWSHRFSDWNELSLYERNWSWNPRELSFLFYFPFHNIQFVVCTWETCTKCIQGFPFWSTKDPLSSFSSSAWSEETVLAAIACHLSRNRSSKKAWIEARGLFHLSVDQMWPEIMCRFVDPPGCKNGWGAFQAFDHGFYHSKSEGWFLRTWRTGRSPTETWTNDGKTQKGERKFALDTSLKDLGELPKIKKLTGGNVN